MATPGGSITPEMTLRELQDVLDTSRVAFLTARSEGRHVRWCVVFRRSNDSRIGRGTTLAEAMQDALDQGGIDGGQ